MALNGKTAVVTGAAMGIGRAITELLLKNGAKVALLDVNKTGGQTLVESLSKQYGPEQTLFLHCNVESEEEFKAAFQTASETFGGIDILCNNAGILNEVTWEKMVFINLNGVIRGTYLALDHMSKLNGGRGGVIINTASIAGLGPFANAPVYTATKHGVVGFTRSMAAASDISGYGIRFNALCPGLVQTDLLTNTPLRLGRFSNLKDTANPLAKDTGILLVDEVAKCVLELVTDETKNGEALVVCKKGKAYMPFPSAASIIDQM
ncbi:15-hydroxyprostaglandin dehydrogenase [NAD(+)]-like [Pholidichthys leucotaenia]